MHKEQEERRDFLPDLIAHLDRVGAREIVLEEGYGLGVGIPVDAYLDVSGRVRVGSHEECLDQEVVVVLRCPEQRELRRLRPETVWSRCCTIRLGPIARRSSPTWASAPSASTRSPTGPDGVW